MKPIRVLIVDDSLLIRQMFREILSAAPDIEVLDVASNPLEARDKIKQLNPDVLTLDIEMPHMDGISFLEKIMTLRPMPVVMVSSLTQKGATETLRALELGAVDVVAKPVSNQNRATIGALGEELVEKIRHAAQARVRPLGNPVKHGGLLPFHPNLARRMPLVAIGASTGGVEALRELFGRFPAHAPAMVIAQHMPAQFTGSFAKRLNDMSAMTVLEATHRATILPGHAYIAPGGKHLRVLNRKGDYVCFLDDGAAVSGHRPSVDVLFESVAKAARSEALGVILTGMGKDGANGLKAMYDAGAHTIAQDRTSCVVYGMPQMACKAGAVKEQLKLADIAPQILRLCEGRVAA